MSGTVVRHEKITGDVTGESAVFPGRSLTLRKNKYYLLIFSFFHSVFMIQCKVVCSEMEKCNGRTGRGTVAKEPP